MVSSIRSTTSTSKSRRTSGLSGGWQSFGKLQNRGKGVRASQEQIPRLEFPALLWHRLGLE
jgi:hypothetical protein